jgi:hypothetical protein
MRLSEGVLDMAMMRVSNSELSSGAVPLMMLLAEAMPEPAGELAIVGVTDVKWRTWTDGGKDANFDHHFDE